MRNTHPSGTERSESPAFDSHVVERNRNVGLCNYKKNGEIKIETNKWVIVVILGVTGHLLFGLSLYNPVQLVSFSLKVAC